MKYSLLLAVVMLFSLTAGVIGARNFQQPAVKPLISADQCQPLAPAAGATVSVDTVAELENAVNTAVSGETILIADGIYNLDGVYLRIDTPNVTLRSASGNREAVVLDGNYSTTGIIQICRLKRDGG